MNIDDIKRKIKKVGDPEVAAVSRRFFKTGRGEYGEGETFAGIRVPVLRSLAKELGAVDLSVVWELLESGIHEERLLALLLLIAKFDRADEAGRKAICLRYLKKTKYINNWDLVDCSAEHIAGRDLLDKDKGMLYKLAQSDNIWERRIAIMSTFHYIKQGLFDDALGIAALLLNDKQDLIHKAVGWMLREIGKRNIAVEKKFLNAYQALMPRTMLRYAIERFPETERKKYLR